jgi:hypothetical protein
MDLFMAKPKPILSVSKSKPFSFMSYEAFKRFCELQQLDLFRNVIENIEDNAFYWKEWMEHSDPET